MSLYELENEKAKLEKEYERLTEVVTTENINQKGLDAGYETRTGTVGSSKEIKNVREELKRINSEIRQVIEYQKENERMQPIIDQKLKEEKQKEKEAEKLAKEREREKKLMETKDNAKKIKSLKKFYKNGHFIERVFAKIFNNSPNWKDINGYTKEELEFLLNIYKGNTNQQRMYEEKIESKMRSQNSNFKQIRKAKSNSRWDDFTDALANKKSLKIRMRKEEEHKKGIL